MKHEIALAFCAICGFAAMADNYDSTGATVTKDGDAEIYTWTDTNIVGTIVVPEGGALFDVLLVGGGGAGGWCRGGGGGGGGVVYQTGLFLEAGTYSIKVGAGGTPDKWGGSYDQTASTEQTDGRPTTISNGTTQVRIAYGGGGGATFSKYGYVGRSVGGSSGGSTGQNIESPEVTTGQGNRGGKSQPTFNACSGGGGGAGAAGGDATSSKAGDGGAGFKCAISGLDVWYGAGGGGGSYSVDMSSSGAGGTGGGGHGGVSSNNDLTAGADGVGAGGGGASGGSNSAANCGGARGGSGVVVLRTASASRPICSDVQVVVNGSSVTFSSTLLGMGTNPEGSASATSCNLYLAYGTNPDNLDHSVKKTEWTLTDSVWSKTINDIPAYAKFYWRMALTNNLNIGAEKVQRGTNLTLGVGQPLPLKYSFSDSAFTLHEDEYAQGYYDLPALLDGSTGYECNLNRSIVTNILFDAGEAKTVPFFRGYCLLSGTSLTNTLENFELYGSNDKSAWTKLADVDDFIGGMKTKEWMEAVLPQSTAFRYFEMRGVLDARFAEIQFVSEDMSIKLEKPTFYLPTTSDQALSASYDPDGVTISGTLVRSTSAETEVYGYYAAADYDNNESAWEANGTKFTFSGTYATGGTFSQKFKIPGRGQRFVRLFAKSGANVTCSQRTWEIGLRAQPKIVPVYVTRESFFKVYDGNTSTSDDAHGRAFAIFDLRGLGKNEVVSHLRIWPVLGQYNQYTWSRTRYGRMYVSYDDATFTPSGETLVAGREVYKIAKEPSVSWSLIKPYLDDMEKMHVYTDCIYPDIPSDRRPTFIKIGHFFLDNCREIELRTVDNTKGLLLIVR